jgi:hypothetical protein
MPTAIAMVAIFIATALQPPMVQAGHTTPLPWTTPTEFREADWTKAQNFGGATPWGDFGGTLVTNFLALVKVAPPAKLRTLLDELKPSIVSQVLMAFRNQDTRGKARSAGAAPAIEPSAEALYGRLIQKGIISIEEASASPTGPVVEGWDAVVFEKFPGKSGLGGVMEVLEPIIAQKLAELLAVAPQITTRLDDTVLGSDSDRPTHTATPLDHRRVPVFLRVAKRLWLRINLLRFFTEGLWARAPVLFGRTGVQRLFAPVNSELELEAVTQFNDVEELYQWIRSMLTVVEFTASFVLCMDCLCR